MKLLIAEYFKHINDFNFTAHCTREDFEKFNIDDSIIPFQKGLIPIEHGMRVCDIGTGGGFPGMPLAVLNPEIKFLLIDSVQKKLTLIDTIVKELEMKNVQTLHSRLEEVGQSQLRETFDVVVSKAVAKWSTLLELALPLVSIGGYFYAYQGKAIFEELEKNKSVIEKLGGAFEETFDYNIGDEKRYIVKVKKIRPTQRAFPRKAPLPKDNPLT